jgi:hypothetical protein
MVCEKPGRCSISVSVVICFTRFSSFSFVYVLYVVPLVATSSVLSVVEFSLSVFSNVDGIEKKWLYLHIFSLIFTCYKSIMKQLE